MLVDSHAHLDSAQYDTDRTAMLERAWTTGIGTILAIGIGDGPATMHRALDISREYAGRPNIPRIFASAGIYPHEAVNADQQAYDALDDLLQRPEVIATGEIGLDYYHQGAPHPIQKQVFSRQMEISATSRKPIIIHCRPAEGTPGGSADGSTDCWDDTLNMIEQQWKRTGLGGILHCFGGEWQHARRALDCGFLISFAGNITYPKAQSIRDVAAMVPLDRMLIETDSPYLAPTPDRGKRNEPAFVSRVAAKLAELKSTDVENVASCTTQNFRRLFGLTPDVGNW